VTVKVAVLSVGRSDTVCFGGGSDSREEGNTTERWTFESKGYDIYRTLL
jgi:hypothetical protein